LFVSYVWCVLIVVKCILWGSIGAKGKPAGIVDTGLAAAEVVATIAKVAQITLEKLFTCLMGRLTGRVMITNKVLLQIIAFR
jgi:hypothetical protein